MFETPFRLATIGESSVGKTSIIRIISGDRFDSSESTTVGVDFGQITKVINGEKVALEIWDTAGQERFRSLVPVYCRNVNAALAVFDITSKDSFEHLDSWIELFRSLGEGKRLVFVVGNKIDLAQPEADQVDLEAAKEWATKNSLPFFLCSAKTGEGIDKLIDSVIKTLIEAFPRKQMQDPLDLAENKQTKSKGCC